MVLHWWNSRKSTWHKKDEIETGSKSENNGIERNRAENPNNNSTHWGTALGSWRRVFKKEKRKKVDVGVGDGVVNEEIGTWKFLRFLGRNPEINKPNNESKSPEEAGKFVNSLQREVVVVQKEVISSSIASMLSTLISHPLDVIKTNVQSAHFSKGVRGSFKTRLRILYVIRHIFATRGVRRFYKGHGFSQWDSIFHTTSMFLTYHHVNQHLKDVQQLKAYPNFVSFVSGFVSASVSVMALYPFSKLRELRLTKQRILETYGPIVAASLIREGGNFRPIFRGCLSLFLHMGTQYGFRFFFFEKIREEMIQKQATREKATSTNSNVSAVDSINELSNFKLLLAGGLSAILGDLLAHPLDVIHSRICMPALIRQNFRFDRTCRRYFQCAIMILKHEGISAFYSGLTPSMLKSTVNTAVQFAVYEKVHNWLRSFFPT